MTYPTTCDIQKESYKYQIYYILKGEKGETGPMGPQGTVGEKGARGRRGKRVTYSKQVSLIGLSDFLIGISGDLSISQWPLTNLALFFLLYYLLPDLTKPSSEDGRTI